MSYLQDGLQQLLVNYLPDCLSPDGMLPEARMCASGLGRDPKLSFTTFDPRAVSCASESQDGFCPRTDSNYPAWLPKCRDSRMACHCCGRSLTREFHRESGEPPTTPTGQGRVSQHARPPCQPWRWQVQR